MITCLVMVIRVAGRRSRRWRHWSASRAGLRRGSWAAPGSWCCARSASWTSSKPCSRGGRSTRRPLRCRRAPRCVFRVPEIPWQCRSRGCRVEPTRASASGLNVADGRVSLRRRRRQTTATTGCCRCGAARPSCTPPLFPLRPSHCYPAVRPMGLPATRHDQRLRRPAARCDVVLMCNAGSVQSCWGLGPTSARSLAQGGQKLTR